jgi:hypothetical protein
VRAQNAPRRSRSHPIAKVIDPALRQRLASAAWRKADRCAARQATTTLALIMLAVTAGAFLLVTWVATKGLFVFL